MLLADLHRMHDATVAANLPRADGQVYRPTRFKQALDRVTDGAGAVAFVHRLWNRCQSDGFDTILASDRADLTAEWLVVDESKPYHDLFSATTVAVSRERLTQFPTPGNAGTS